MTIINIAPPLYLPLYLLTSHYNYPNHGVTTISYPIIVILIRRHTSRAISLHCTVIRYGDILVYTHAVMVTTWIIGRIALIIFLVCCDMLFASILIPNYHFPINLRP